MAGRAKIKPCLLTWLLPATDLLVMPRKHPILPNPVIFWDESHLWGLLMIRAVKALGFKPTLVSAKQITAGILSTLTPSTLLVPGGWARLKSLALGASGRQAIRDYLERGGHYLGVCGGAGLGLASEKHTPFLDLCTWSRKSTQARLPNFSGHLHCQVQYNNQDNQVLLPVWWPSQFLPNPASPLNIIASYTKPGPDFWSADLLWSGLTEQEIVHWEHLYGINLNPKHLEKEPCIVQGTLGQGSFILSYPHLETPDSSQANALLAQLLGLKAPYPPIPQWSVLSENPIWTDKLLQEISTLLQDILFFGHQHFLLFWRTPWLLGWRRGVPGSALNFLVAMVWQARHSQASQVAEQYWQENGPQCLALCQEFCRLTRQYLLQERRVLATTPSSPECSASPSLQNRKQELFGKFPGYGGLYGRIIKVLDALVWHQLS